MYIYTYKSIYWKSVRHTFGPFNYHVGLFYPKVRPRSGELCVEIHGQGTEW